MSPTMLAAIAIVISLASLGVSGWVAFRDRARIAVSSVYYEASEYGAASIAVKISNKGRRPFLVQNFVLAYDNGESLYRGLRDVATSGGLQLGERQSHSEILQADDLQESLMEGVGHLREAYFIDGLDERYIPKNIVSQIKHLTRA